MSADRIVKSYSVDLLVSYCIGNIVRRSDPRLPLLHTHTEGHQLFSCSVDAVGDSCDLGVGEHGVFVQV